MFFNWATLKIFIRACIFWRISLINTRKYYRKWFCLSPASAQIKSVNTAVINKRIRVFELNSIKLKQRRRHLKSEISMAISG